MRIWIDICNAPHVIFFKEIIKIWQKQGHEVIVTARELSGSMALLEANHIDYIEIGEHYGRNPFAKIWGLAVRCIQLHRFLKNKNIDAAVSQSSFYSPLVAYTLGVPSLYTNDNEYAKGNLIAHLFANKVLYPQCLKEKFRQSIFGSKLSFYPGVKEGIYLCDLFLPKETTTGNAVTNICIRPEPWTAQYHKKNDGKFEQFLRSITAKYQVTILPRGETQREYYQAIGIDNLSVSSKPLTLEQLVRKFDVFIGAGGSMSREAAFLGMPALSIYQGKLLAVDHELINRGCLTHTYTPDIKLVTALFKRTFDEQAFVELRDAGKKARDILINEVISLVKI